MSRPKQSLGDPVMVRFAAASKETLQSVAEANGLSLSAIIRLAVERQLPALRSGGTSLRPARSARSSA
jgi:hypothetical protein